MQDLPLQREKHTQGLRQVHPAAGRQQAPRDIAVQAIVHQAIAVRATAHPAGRAAHPVTVVRAARPVPAGQAVHPATAGPAHLPARAIPVPAAVLHLHTAGRAAVHPPVREAVPAHLQAAVHPVQVHRVQGEEDRN